MNRTLSILSWLCCGATMTAQTATDSTDVFYKHLRINELTVTGLTGQSKLRDMAAPVSVVTARELRASVGTNIVDAISHQPGVAQVTTGSGIAKPVIRGLGYNRVLVVNDGVRQEGQQWGDEHGLEIDDQAVNSVEILKGPASLMYGSDAMAGVLILHSAPTLAEGEHRASASTEYQTNSGLIDYSLAMAGNDHGLVWSARYSEKMAHEYKAPVDGYVPGTQFHNRAASLLLGLERHWGHSWLRGDCFHLTPSIAEGERDELTGLLEHDYKLKTYHKQLPFQQVKHYKLTWDNALHLGQGMLKAIVAYQQNRRQEFEDDASECELYFRLHTLTYDVGFQQSLDKGKLALGLNGMFQQSGNLAEETLIPDYKLLDGGVYVTASADRGRWTHSAGLRADWRTIYHYGDYTGLTGSLGTVCRLTDDVNLRLNLARGFRSPNMSELGSDGVHEGTLRYEIGNPDLKAEYSWQADLGADYSGHYLSAQASLFLNRIENYIFAHRIDRVIEPDYRTYTYTQGTALLKGFEASVDFHPIHQIHLGNSFSYVDTRLLHQGPDTRHLPMTPPARWNVDLKYELTHQGYRLTRSGASPLMVKNTFLAIGMETTLAQDKFYKADDTETRTPGYTLFNISAGTDLMVRGKKRAELYLSAQNLFDTAYQSHLSRLKYTDVNLVSGRQGIYNPGRNIAVKLVLPFYW